MADMKDKKFLRQLKSGPRKGRWTVDIKQVNRVLDRPGLENRPEYISALIAYNTQEAINNYISFFGKKFFFLQDWVKALYANYTIPVSQNDFFSAAYKALTWYSEQIAEAVKAENMGYFD